MEKSESTKEFLEFIAKHQDCPETLFKLAKTDFEKACVIEFFELSKKFESLKKDIQWLKWMIKGVFIVSIVAVLAQVISDCFVR
jgi:hypothetical protein